MFNKNINITGAILLLFILTCTVVRGDDVADLGNRLVARRNSLSAGSVDFNAFNVVMNSADYDSFRKTILKSQDTSNIEDVSSAVIKTFDSSTVERNASYSGTLYYHFNNNQDKWRLNRSRSMDFISQQNSAISDAVAKGALVRGNLKSEDVAFDGDHITLLQNGEQLWYRAAATQMEYIKPGNLDISLMDWNAMNEKGAAPGQTITAHGGNDEVSLDFISVHNSKTASATYYFSKDLGYAPTHVVVQAGQRMLSEIIYSYQPDAKSSAVPVTPRLRNKADFRPDGKIQVELFIFREWRQNVKDEDLKVTLPAKYLLIDERLGGRPVMVSRDQDQETQIEDPSFNRPNSKNSATTQPETMPTSDSRSKLQKYSPPSLSHGTIKTHSIFEYILWFLSICGCAWILWRLINSKRKV